ncbi:hypothetical protein [Sinorhizobium meliloti]|uniref:hypothetical protein n=1 Tax=Rhizobium meliloti TaxID=382 RepID=UPI003F5CE40A
MSSWISRHASFYAIPPLGMLRQCLPEASSLRSADRNLTATQVIRLAGIFSTEPATLRRLTFSNVAPRFPTPDCSQTATVLLSLPSE